MTARAAIRCTALACLRQAGAPGKRSDGFISWRANFLDERRDAFVRAGVRDASGMSGRFVGNQIEARARTWLIPGNLRLEVGGAVLLEGEFLRRAPNATGNGDPLFFYSDLTFNF